MKRRCVETEPALVRLPTDLLQIVISFSESSLPGVLALQLISRHFRRVMRLPHMLSAMAVTLRRPADIPGLGAMVTGVRDVKFLSATPLMRGLKAMTGLRELDLSQCKTVNNETINIISFLVNLETLSLNECSKVSDLSGLESLPALKTLDTSCCFEIQRLPLMPNMKTLKMSGCNGVRSWNSLASMHNLGFLALSGCALTDSVLRLLPENVYDLDVGFCRPLTDACLPAITRCSKLKVLNLSGCSHITHLSPLGNLKGLVEIKLVFCTGLRDLGALSDMPALRVVYAPHTELASEALKYGLKNLPQLECLELSHSRLTHVGLNFSLNKLARLELRFCSLLHDLSALSACKSLTTLDLSNCPMVNDQSLEHLACVPELVHLDLNACSDLTDQGLSEVAKLLNLKHLSLNNCIQFTNAGVARLAFLSQLQTLELQGCNAVTDAGLHALSGLREMRVLNLSYLTGITDAGLFALLSMPDLRSLHLDSCRKLTDVGLNALRALQNLSNLDLSRCRGVETLAPLQSVTSLRWLNVSGCVRVTDASLLNLVQCKKLDVLYSNHCRKITKHGLLMMRQLISL
jgi:hypothetical protein